jgi:hypothetical protein
LQNNIVTQALTFQKKIGFEKGKKKNCLRIQIKDVMNKIEVNGTHLKNNRAK